MKRLIVALSLMQIVWVVGIAIPSVSAASAPSTDAGALPTTPGSFCQQQIGGFFGFPTWYKYLDVNFGGAPCEVNFDAGEPLSYVRVAMAVFEILMRIAGMAAVAFVMYGAFQLLTSQGEPDRYAGARNSITNALIGLIITLFAVAIVNLVGANI